MHDAHQLWGNIQFAWCSLYRQRPADVVSANILRPDRNGFDTVMELTRQFLNVKVIAVSGRQ